MTRKLGVSCTLGVALFAAAAVASAQEGPVAPSAISLTGPPTPAPVVAPGAPAAPAVRLAPATAPSSLDAPLPKEAPPEYAGNDHDLFVHHLAFGYFGVSQLPVGTGSSTPGIVNAPVIGVRYWASRMVGVDLGLGFGYSSTSGGGAVSSDTWGVALHAGLPLSLAQSKHFSFEVVPLEVTLGFSGSSAGAGFGGASGSGFLAKVGARVGAELQFGFIGIPQLALEGSLGLYVQHESFGEGATSVSQTLFATSVGSDPWAVFTDTISALYYF